MLLALSCAPLQRQSVHPGAVRHTEKCPGNHGKDDLRLTNVTEEEKSAEMFRKFLCSVPVRVSPSVVVMWNTQLCYNFGASCNEGGKMKVSCSQACW